MNTGTEQIARTLQVILNQPSDWNDWFEIIKRTAITYDVWDYIDPDKTTSSPTKESEPTIQEYSTSAASIADLNDAQLSRYKWAYTTWSTKQQETKQVLKNIAHVNDKITSSIARKHFHIIWGKDSARDTLKALRTAIAPSPVNRQLELRRRYNQLKTIQKGKNIENWFEEWRIVVALCQQANLPEAQGNYPQQDFLTAAQGIDNTWATTLLHELYTTQMKALTDTTVKVKSLEEYVAEFTWRVHQNNLTKAQSTYSAYSTELAIAQPTENTYSSNSNSNNNNKKKKKHKCVCGMGHKWWECFHLNEEHPKRPSTWKTQKYIQDKIDIAKQDTKLWMSIQEAIKKWKDDTKKQSINLDDNNPPQQSSVNAVITEQPSTIALDDGYMSNQQQFHVAFTVEGPTDTHSIQNRWILDPGSNTHVINSEDWPGWTRKYEQTGNQWIKAGTQSIAITAWGDVTIPVRTPKGVKQATLTHVAYVRGCLTNLIGLSRCRTMGIHFDSGLDILYKSIGDGSHKRDTLIHMEYTGGHWLIDQPAKIQANSISLTSMGSSYDPKPNLRIDAETAHTIWGHPAKSAVEKLAENVDGLSIDTHNMKDFCAVCTEAKLTKLNSRRSHDNPAQKPFERIYIDLVQLRERGEQTYNGDVLMGHAKDQFSKWHEVETVRQKDSSTLKDWIVKLIRTVQRQFRYNILYIRLDNERGYGSWLRDLCNQLGIIYEPIAEHTPPQNGGAEQAGSIIIVRARALALQSNLPLTLSNELVRTASYILNRTPTKALNWRTPYEIVWGHKPKVQHMRPIGCQAYVLNRRLKRGQKLVSRAIIGYLVGYDSTNIYRIWMPHKNEVIRTRDVQFNVGKFFSEKDIPIADPIIEEIVDTIAIPDKQAEDEMHLEELLTSDQQQYHDEIMSNNSADSTDITQQDTENNLRISESQKDDVVDGLQTPTSMVFVRQMSAPPPPPQEQSATEIADYVPDRYNNNAPRRRNLEISEDNVLAGPRTRTSRNTQDPAHWASHAAYLGGNSDTYIESFSTQYRDIKLERHHQSTLPEPPKSYAQINGHIFEQQWLTAADAEINKIFKMGCLKETHFTTETADGEVLPLMWVFTYKFDEDGYLTQFKARLVVRGDKQQAYDETYAATIASKSYRAMMAIVNQFDLEVRQYDVPTAFLFAELQRKLYVIAPDGYKGNSSILLVLRALYGLKEAPALWYKCFRETLLTHGMREVEGFPCLYASSTHILFVHVDDIVTAFAKASTTKYELFEAVLKDKYSVKISPSLSWFLGVRVVRDRAQKKLWLLQDSYIDKVAAKYGILVKGKAPDTPLRVNHLDRSTEEPNSQRTKRFQELVGSLAYIAVISRPDVARAHIILATHLVNPGQKHVDAALHVWRYLINTKYYALQAQYMSNQSLQGFLIDDKLEPYFYGASDASFADEQETRRSSQGFVFKLFNLTIDWKSTLQRTVTKSTTEAELLSLSLAGSEMEEWIRFFNKIQLKFDDKPILWCDNQQTVGIVNKEHDKLSTKLKHVDIHQLWLRQEVQHQRIKVQWVPTNTMPADGLTKMLSPQRHIEFVRQLGLIDIRERVNGKI